MYGLIAKIQAERMGEMLDDKHPTHEVRPYVDLHTVYPDEEIKSDTYTISKFELSVERVRIDKVRNMMDGNGWLTNGLQPNFPYVRLYKNGEGVMMSDTPMERNSNRDFVKKANGDVLIFGLGLGLIILPLLQAEDVKTITVVELHQDLIDVVEPILKAQDHADKLSIVQGDCFEYHKDLPKEKKWDCVYGDIWIDINGDNYPEMKTITKNFKHRINRKNPNCILDHWLKTEMQRKYLDERAWERSFNCFG